MAYSEPENPQMAAVTLKATRHGLLRTGQKFTLAGGAVVSRSEEAFYRYYEARIKASKISMSSTFGMGKNSSAHRETSYVGYNGDSPATDLSELLEHAFDKNFKRYAPDKYYPKGRFFDLRTDLLEVGGSTKLNAPGWKKWYHSGLDLDQLTEEQKTAYDRLGKVLEARRHIPVAPEDCCRTTCARSRRNRAAPGENRPRQRHAQ